MTKHISARALSGALAKSRLTRRAFLPLLTTVIAAATPAKAKPTQAAPVGSEAGTIWWSELRTRDLGATRAFYSGVIGWTSAVVAQDDMGRPPAAGEKGYTVFKAHGQEVAGAEEIEPNDATGSRPGWFTYVQVDDVDEAARTAIALGGKIVLQPFDATAVGRMAEIEDPEGNRLGLISPRA